MSEQAGRAAEHDSVEGMSPSMRTRPPRARPRLAWWQALPVVARDAVGGVGLFVLSLLPLGVQGVALGELHHQVAPWVSPLLIVGQTLPLALRRIRPGVAFAIVGLAFAAAQLAGVDTGVAGLGLFIAIYSFAAYQRRHRLVIDVATTVAYAVLAVALYAEGSPNRLIDWVTFFLVLTTPWFIGQLVRRRLAEQASREARAAQRAVRDARNQLARDLHDIVTHHVTAIVVQADSSAYLDDADSAERAQVLDSIGRAGRRALQELRSLLGALEQSPPSPDAGLGSPPLSPHPTSVVALVRESKASGYPVELVETGSATETSEAVEVTLYRVAQEALTNAMKHAPGEPVSVTVKHGGGLIEMSVVNRLKSSVGIPGRGLTGMHERVALLDGRVEANAVEDRFVVRAVVSAMAEARAADA